MKKLLVLLLAFAMVFSLCACGNNDEPEEIAWPEKDIQLIIPYGAGGDTDTYARQIASQLEDILGVSVVCSNVTGSAGSIAADQVMNSPADGYTVLWTHNTLLCNKAFGTTDYAHEAFETANIMVNNSSYYFFTRECDFATWQDFADYCKAHPGEVSLICPLGGFAHLVTCLTLAKSGLDVKVVEGKDAATCCVEVFSGRAQGVAGTFQSMSAYYQTGDPNEFTALACYGEERLDVAKDAPTFKELGYDGLDAYMYFGFFFPKGTDEKIIDKWNAACKQVAETAEFKDLCAKYSADAVWYAKGDAVAEWDTMLDSFMSVQEYLK